METLLDQLESLTPGGYLPGGPLATEPTAWAAMALARAGRDEAAGRAGDWLVSLQARNGSVSVGLDSSGPHWTTSLAILAWDAIDTAKYKRPIERAAGWLLTAKGKPAPRSPHMGHDTTLIGWSWAADTHSWLEPTAFATMALRTAGHAGHARHTEARRILLDRILPTGGCNYGNTEVLGQMLLPHLQPSGVVMWALAREDARHGASATSGSRIDLSLDYLEQQLARRTGGASLAYAILALTAWKRRPANAQSLIAEALERPSTRGSTYKLALLALAADGETR